MALQTTISIFAANSPTWNDGVPSGFSNSCATKMESLATDKHGRHGDDTPSFTESDLSSTTPWKRGEPWGFTMFRHRYASRCLKCPPVYHQGIICVHAHTHTLYIYGICMLCASVYVWIIYTHLSHTFIYTQYIIILYNIVYKYTHTHYTLHTTPTRTPHNYIM